MKNANGRPRTHGHCSATGRKASPTYMSWNNMLTRCQCVSHKQFKDYGGAGVKVVERWKTFVNFLEDLGVRPTGTTLGRLLDKGDYKPGNAFWMTREEQRANRTY